VPHCYGPSADGYIRCVRRRPSQLWIGSLPLAAIIGWLGYASLDRYPLFAVACFISVTLVVIPVAWHQLMGGSREAITRRSRVGEFLVIAAAGVVVIGFMAAAITSGNRPPGSP
jgi:hypothetical protein